MIEQDLKQRIDQAIVKCYPDASLPSYMLSRPEREEHGDYATSVAFVLAGQLKQSPLTVAETVARAISVDETIHKVEAVAPGYINITLKERVLLEQLNQVKAGTDRYGQQRVVNPQQILFEYGQPNTHKIPHIGHLYSYCYGESAVRLLEAIGHKVYRANYQGDVGLHVAKCLWAYKQESKDQTSKIKNTDSMPLAEKVQYLQECYQVGSAAYDDDPSAKAEINEMNRSIYQADLAIHALWQETRQWSLDYYRAFEAKLGITYDSYYLESQVSDKGKAIVTAHVGPVFEEDQGAIIFRGEPHGLHTRVFVNQAGNPTYEAKDIGLAEKKREDYQFDLSIITTANEQNAYWQVVKKAIELIWPDYIGKIKHMGYGLINLTTGKMSSRTGQIVTAPGLVAMVEERIKAYIDEHRDYPDEDRDAIAQKVAIGAIKYSFLKSAALKNMTFDLESSIAFDGDSGPYLLYTYVRCLSLLRKAGLDRLSSVDAIDPSYSMNELERSLVSYLSRFPEVVTQAAESYSPHIVANYLFDLAQRFSLFYDRYQIVTDNKAESQFRLAVTAVVGQTLKNGLDLLGIETVDKI